MRRLEQLEARLPLAAQVIDLNPGFYGSQIEPVRLVDEWLYMEATVGEERRLMKTDGESFVDLGPELPFLQQFLRGEQLIGVTETGVAAWDFTTDTLTVLSDKPGGQVLNGETVMWFTQETTQIAIDPDDGSDDRWAILIDYVDLEGRTLHLEGESGYEGDLEFTPENVFGDAIVGVGDIELFESNSRRYIVRDGVATIAPLSNASLELAGQLLFERNIDAPEHINYITEAGDFVMEKPDRLYDFGTGAWIVDDGVISRYAEGVITPIGTVSDAEWTPEFKIAYFWDANEFVFGGKSDLWGQEPYKATIEDEIQFIGNYGFGPGGVSFNPLGIYEPYRLMASGGTAYLYDGDQFIPTAIDLANFVHMTDTHVLLKNYTEPTGGELLQYDLLPGDANLDGLFDSADLVHLFQLGEYEDSLVGNSTKATGDFDGNGEFDTSDLVLAFQQGLYEAD